ncbi:hypothetical protein JD844_002739 [Phrynosoma platyrhinos]|uniref:Transglutaminase-like domain-containing protein n=1 Tax=Phrynosoma platyrhinos TaxID=52577 RepID=A0ABQ7TC54_PHRPL|nr:hypothetical protein JD844_002739 [Phrynosoma platyrhinos]
MSKTIECSLKAIGVDFLRKENTCLHHTSKFKNDSLIVRRGQEFNLKVTFSRELKDNDEIILKLSIDTPFEEDILDCCMYLLDKSLLGPNDKRNPVKITRAMSALKGGELRYQSPPQPSLVYVDCESILNLYGKIAILDQGVNMEDEKGVLFGKWEFENQNNSCEGSPCPSEWKDSVRILKQYYRTKKPVLYAQCWVFSGVLNTVMRCLGIPARSVTTYNAGRDTDNNINIDAIKNGEVNHNYDTMFLFSAVNAEIVFWKIKKVNGKDAYVPEKDKYSKIGTKIITKAIGNEKAEDIIDEYKFPEDSEEEKRAMKTALSHVKSPTRAAAEVLRSLKASIKLTLEKEEKLVPGQPIDLNIVVSNKTAGALKVNLSVSSYLESYAGKVHARFLPIQEIIRAEGKRDVKILISVKDYMKTLSLIEDELQLKVNISGHVQETNEKYTETVTLAFQYPQLQVVIPEKAKVNENFGCEVIFKNTFSIPLENCRLLVEDLDISPVKAFDHGIVPPNGIKRSKLNCAAKKIGDQMIVAKWNSTQVKGITAVKFIEITE